MAIRSELPLIGDVVAGRYQITSLLGEGGMGIVYAATDPVLSREVALKVLRPSVARRPDARKRFIREAKLSAALAHPNAVQIYDFGEDGDRLYIAMEKLHGEDLDIRLKREGRQSPARAIAVVHPVADVLASAHSKGMVHRDIKPANVFLESSDKQRVVVLDFGMAFLLEPTEPDAGRLTRDGLSGGTPLYMSPEQCCNENIGPHSDVYSLGCLLFELIAGHPPFYGQPTAKLLTNHLYAMPARLRELRPDVPRALEELVSRMLAKPPTERPTAEAVRRRVAAIEGSGIDARERSRDASYLSSRAARAVPRPTPTIPFRDGPQSPIGVLVLGEAPRELAVGLAAAGLNPTFSDDVQLAASAELIYLSGDIATIAAVTAISDSPVVVGAAGLSVDELRALLRLGVDDVVARPTNVAEVASKLRRAHEKANRRKTDESP